MIVNGQGLLAAAPIKDMMSLKGRFHGVSHGLAEVGYDIRLKQDITFYGHSNGLRGIRISHPDSGGTESHRGRFTKASALEEFNMPHDLVGMVTDKSTWAREGLSVFNTVIEPGWFGFLTLELVYHGNADLHLPAGVGIAQVIFSRLENPGVYTGKYQGQADRPVDAIYEKG